MVLLVGCRGWCRVFLFCGGLDVFVFLVLVFVVWLVLRLGICAVESCRGVWWCVGLFCIGFFFVVDSLGGLIFWFVDL